MNVRKSSANLREAKLQQLVDEEGGDLDQLLENALFDSSCQGICMAPNCDFTVSCCEPDARTNWCEGCGRNTVESILSLAGVI